MKTRDAIMDLVDNAVQMSYAKLSSKVVERTKQAILDTVGAIIAGSTAPGSRQVCDLVSRWGGAEESNFFGSQQKVPFFNAAFANGVMGRAREIDDYHAPTGDHPSVAAVTSALAVAQQMGRVSGKDILTAISVAEDAVLRIRLATKMGPWTTGTYAPFTAAIVAAKLMNLSETKTLDAIGLAFSQASNTRQCHHEGTLAVRVQNGLAIKAGLVAAQLADAGVTGPHDILEGEFGLYRAFHGGKYERRKITTNLGSHFEIVNVSIKPYSSCALTHGAIEGALAITLENMVEPEKIKEITVYVNTDSYLTVGLPEARKQVPQTVVDAQFSIPYTVANAVIKKDVFLDDFTADAIKEEEVLSISRKVKTVCDPSLDLLAKVVAPTIIEFKLMDGRTITRRVDYTKGSPENPMTIQENEQKFFKCLKYSMRKIPKDACTQFFHRIRNLEILDDVGDTFSILTHV